MPTAAPLALPPTSLRPGDRVCVAVSGGGDSVALLHLMAAANARRRNPLGVGLSAVHVHHGLRGAEADRDQAFVEALCARLAVPLHLRQVDTPARIRAARESTEQAARHLRYGVFRALFAAGEATHILTAHTLDDQAETVLMKLLRGAWLEGLGGIAPLLRCEGGTVLRPLLGVRREALRAHLRSLGEPRLEDETNRDPAHTRNRLRLSVLPALRAENPALDRTLSHMAELAREDEEHWSAEVEALLDRLLLPGKPVRGGGRSNSTAPGARACALELERLRALDPALRRRVVRGAAARMGFRLGFDETARLLALAGFPAAVPDPTVPSKPGATLRLAGGLLAERSLRELRLSATAQP